MSLAQYASPYNNDDSVDTNNINANIKITQSQNQNQNRGKGGGMEKRTPMSTFRKTIKRPQQKQEQNVDPPSRVANFMSKLSAVKSMNQVQGGGGDDGTSGSDADLADYHPMNLNEEENNMISENYNQTQNGSNRDDVVTRESFENLPSTYASQYYQQYVPLSYSSQQMTASSQGGDSSSILTGSKDDLIQKMNHIIHMLEDQQDEKTGSVTEELILYCFLGVFVIFVVDSFVRAGKYVR